MAFWGDLLGTAAEIEHDHHRYRVELRMFSLGKNLTLLRDGVVVQRAAAPARFALGGGATIVVDSTEHGFRVAELREPGQVRPLEPAAGTWEAARVAWGRRHPAADRVLTVTSGAALLIGLGYVALQLLQTVTSLGPVQDLLGGWSFVVPYTPPPLVQIIAGVLIGAAGADTALRMSPALRARRTATTVRRASGEDTP